MLGELVTFKNDRQFHHDGILYRDPSSSTTVVHIHGSFGNFYQNEFLRTMAEEYVSAGMNLLCFNLRGHDGLVEAYRNEWDFEYAGGAITPFEDCVADIRAAIEFVRPFSSRIILQGHSQGCDRALHFVISSGAERELILLSPCDSYQLQSNWIAPETVEEQIVRLKSSAVQVSGFDWLPAVEYGIRQGDWDYPIFITRGALLSILCGPPFQLIRLGRPASFFLRCRVLIYIGGDDTLQTASAAAMAGYFRERCPSVTLINSYPEGDHSLWGCEREVARDVVTWVRNHLKTQNGAE
jgi:pimeloyl-ACP methyl ester carboxylesterase